MLVQVFAGGPTGPLGAVRAASAPSPVLNIGFLQTVDSLNPYRGINDPSYVFFGLVYDYPFAFDQDGKTIPNLITSASCANPMCTVWNYTVRQNVHWSDGSLMTPTDVNFTWNYDSQNLAKLWAFEPYFNQVAQCSPPKVITLCGAAITGPNGQNVTVYFKRPFAPGKDLFAPIVQYAQWKGVSAAAAETSYANKNPIGTGPFIADPNIYSEFLNLPNQPLHVYRNPNYHPLAGTAVPTVNITDIYLWVFTDPTSLVNALNQNKIQLAQLPPSAKSAVGTTNILTQTALQAIQEWNEIGITQINSTKLNPVRYDMNFRRALAMATNKDYILQHFYYGLGLRGDSLISPIVPWWYNPVTGGDNLTFNVQAANQILNQSGYTTWTGTPFAAGSYRTAASNIVISYEPPCYQCVNPPSATVTIPAGTVLSFTLATRPIAEFPEEYYTAQYLQAQWAQLGVQITLKPETTESALSTDVYGGAVEMYIWYWSSDQDPNYMLSMQSSWTLDGWSDNYWNNGTYNQYYLSQLADLNYAQRLADVQAAQKVQYESAVYIIYIFPYGVWSMRYDAWTGWGDWTAHPYRQSNAFWGANPLWFSLTCPNCTTGGGNIQPTPPVIQGVSSVSTYVNTPLYFNATTVEPETFDTLNWTWYWGDGNVSYVNNTFSRTVEGVHKWAQTGTYSVSVQVTDGKTNPVATLSPVSVTVLTPPTQSGTIRGNVTDAFGKPLAGAQVLAALENSPAPPLSANSAPTTGAYVLPPLAPGKYNLSASKTFYLTAKATNINLAAGQTVYMNFQLISNLGWIAGNVTDATTKQPIVGALVKVLNGTTTINQNTTKSGGVFNFTVAPGNYTLNVTASGYFGKTTATFKVDLAKETAVYVQLIAVPKTVQGLDPLVIAAVAAVVVIAAIALLVVLLSRRRKAKEKEEGKIELQPKT